MSNNDSDNNGCFKWFLGLTIIFIIIVIVVTGMDGAAVLGDSFLELVIGAPIMLLVLYLVTKALNN